MKTKLCEVVLISEDINTLTNWIEKIEDTFNGVYKFNFRECFFKSENITDYRINIRFESNESKNKIYEKMNLIKANPIKFLK
jgi:hypothetical protein